MITPAELLKLCDEAEERDGSDEQIAGTRAYVAQEALREAAMAWAEAAISAHEIACDPGMSGEMYFEAGMVVDGARRIYVALRDAAKPLVGEVKK